MGARPHAAQPSAATAEGVGAPATGHRQGWAATGGDWYDAALAMPVRRGEVEVEGTPIAYRRWGNGLHTPVVLVHGSGANAAWWDHVAPPLAVRRPVVSLDLSGHGDSGRRPRYCYGQWAAEVRAVALHAGLGSPAAVIAHSFGGTVALHADQLFPGFFAAVVALDPPLRRMSESGWEQKINRALKPVRLYKSQDAAVAAFRTVPPQVVDERIRVHVARQSIEQVDGGWRWKFDPAVFARPQFDLDSLGPTTTDITLIRAQFGSLSAQASRMVARQLGGAARQLVILDAHHHVMFDQPIALIAMLQPLLTELDLRHE